jgi:tRNA dimethylallyltransferase
MTAQSCAGKVRPIFQEELQKILRPPLRNKVIIIAGPTGVGKTAISLQLAEYLDIEVISADSMQVYRGMDIGTAKANRVQREEVRHHLIDIRDITETYNVAQFYQEAHRAILDIHARGAVPVVVGGTGFYLHALLYGPPQGPESDPIIRQKLQRDFDNFGIEPLYEKMKMLDPTYAATITKGDVHKVMRALEIMEITGKPVSLIPWKRQKTNPYFDFYAYYIFLPKDKLYPLLSRRCEEMLHAGFLDEVARLEKMGIRNNRTAAQAIGYKQALEYLASPKTEADYEQFVQAFKKATHSLVKKQITWFRREKTFHWIDLSKHPQHTVAEMIASDYKEPPFFFPDEHSLN